MTASFIVTPTPTLETKPSARLIHRTKAAIMPAVILPSKPTDKSVTSEPSSSDCMLVNLSRHKLIREPQVAEILSLKCDTVRKLRKSGRGPRFVLIGRNVYYRVQDVESFILAHLAVSNA